MRRYGVVTAQFYDVFSGERPLYRPGRLAAVAGLRLAPGDRVMVLGAGTGLDLPLVAPTLGPSGLVVAVDDSPAMLHASGRRTRGARAHRREGWAPVRLVLADATRARTLLPPGVPPVDAVLAVNTLSLIPDWRAAWARATAAARPGARVAVADIGRPEPGSAIMAAWAPLISAVGLGRLDARPWRAVEETCTDVGSASFAHGHAQVRWGRLP